MAIVYQHKTLDGKVFYVGIGKSKSRAFSCNKRSQYWKSFTDKYEYIVEIIYDDISWEDACSIEIELIKQFGRKDLNTGSLLNMTNGGEGGDTMTGKKNSSLSERNKLSKGKPGISLRWINRNGIVKRVKSVYLEDYLNDGWEIGSLKSFKNRIPWNKNLKFEYKPSGRLGMKNNTYSSRPIVKCDHCDKTGDMSNMSRWHFDNCKHKK